MKNRFILAAAVSFFFALGMRGLLAVTPGPPPDENPEGNTGALKTRIETGGGYDVHSGNASRSVTDLRVPGALGVYGLDFTRHWNSVPPDEAEMGAVAPIDFGDSGWVHSWGWSAAYTGYDEQQWDGGPYIWVTKIAITFPDGHVNAYKLNRSDPSHSGQPYTPGEADFAPPGEGVHDYLGKMAPNGFDFWLYLADGGSVHFTGGQGAYRASEVFDPHGLRTDLIYEAGLLREVRQEGGRSLFITWGHLPGLIPSVIAQVDTGGSDVSQRVTYKYQKIGGFYVLANVTYRDDPVPGQTTSARYFYSTCYGGDCSVPPGAAAPEFPILTAADDPRFAGPMTKIGYRYRGYNNGCHRYTPFPRDEFQNGAGYPGAKRDYFRPQPEAILEESSGETGVTVSSFGIGCFNGKRGEANGLNGGRTFYFGRSSGDFGQPRIMGYQLAKVTDFAYGIPGPSLPFVHQNYQDGHPWKVWDGRGQLTELVYTGGGDCGLPGEIHHLDNSVEYYNRVDSSGSEARDPARIPNPHQSWLFWKKDERGQTTFYRRDARRRVKQIDYPDESHEFFEYDNNNPNGLNQITKHILPSGAIETYVYDANTHLLMQEYNSVDGTDARKEYTYDSLGRVATMIDGRARASGAAFTVRMTYNGRHQVLTVEYAAVHAPYPTVRYEYDKYGNCITIIDELGHRKEYTYDAYRRCTSYREWLLAPAWNGNGTVDSRQWDWTYDREVEGLPAQFSMRVASSHTSKEWRIQVEPVFNSAGERRATSRTFDVNNRITSEQTGQVQLSTEPVGTLHAGLDAETHYFTYDQNGQKKTYKDQRQRLATYQYDNRNRLWKTTEYPAPGSSGTSRTTETLYDPAGNKTLVKFPDTRTQRWESYDPFGQPGRFIDERNNPTDLIYCWGPMKKLYKVTTHRARDGGGTEDQLTTFSYDPMGRPTQTIFPDGSDEFGRYKFGQLDMWKTRKGQIKTMHYDARGREDFHTWENGAAPRIVREWDNANRLTRISNAFSVIDYGYDEGGQALWEGNTVAGSGGRVQTTYYRYPNGEVSRLIYPNGTTVERNYTARGQLQRVEFGSGNTTSYLYLRDGRLEQQDYGNGVQSTYEYDGRGVISSLRHKKSANGPDLAYRQYWRDERDRITAWKRGTESSQNWMEDGRGDRYEYDYEGQLTSASYRTHDPEGSAGDPMRGDIFSYDALGNRVRSNYLASRGWLDFTRDDNGLNQYSGWWPYCFIKHDDDLGIPWGDPGRANGVVMQEGWITGSYNALNQPVGMWSAAVAGPGNWMWFGHDPLGRCVKRWIAPSAGSTGYNPATYYYYDGWNLIQEGGGASNATRLYVHGARTDEIVAQITPGNGWLRYFQYDARGHCTLQTDAFGDIVEQYDYDAFGFPYFYDRWGNNMPSSPWGNRFLFTGREWLSELRTYDFRNRMYHPELGRFLQPDPKQFAAGDYNLYRYCHNDPVNKSDPDGLVDLSYTPESDTGRVWENSFNPTDRFTVAGHANSQFIADQNGNKLTPLQVAKDMIAKGYTPEKPVLLVGCETGKGENSFASKLANSLAKLTGAESKVQAPTTKIASGSTKGAEPTVQNNEKTGKPGELKTFTGTPLLKRLKKEE